MLNEQVGTLMPNGMTNAAPEWLTAGLGLLFFFFATFYFLRLARPKMVRDAIGFFDWEGELGHAVCMLAMASSLAVWLVPIPGIVWSWVLGFGTLYYAARALTWGRRLSFNKQWWDWTHSGMYLGMFTMYQALPIGATANLILSALLTLFWLWFSLLYVRDSFLDLKARKALSFVSDLAHLSMGVTMLVMILVPGLLMAEHGHHGELHVPSALIDKQTSASVITVDDTTFAAEVLASKGPVVVLVYGGCEKCAAEIPVFENVAKDYASKAKFVRINKESAEKTCKAFGVENCPAVLIIENGTARSARLDNEVNEAELRHFLHNALNK